MELVTLEVKVGEPGSESAACQRGFKCKTGTLTGQFLDPPEHDPSGSNRHPFRFLTRQATRDDVRVHEFVDPQEIPNQSRPGR